MDYQDFKKYIGKQVGITYSNSENAASGLVVEVTKDGYIMLDWGYEYKISSDIQVKVLD